CARTLCLALRVCNCVLLNLAQTRLWRAQLGWLSTAERNPHQRNKGTESYGAGGRPRHSCNSPILLSLLAQAVPAPDDRRVPKTRVQQPHIRQSIHAESNVLHSEFAPVAPTG